MSEECILSVKINLLNFIKSQNSLTVRWSMNSMSQQKRLEVFIRFVFSNVFAEIYYLSQEIMKNFNKYSHLHFREVTFFAKLEISLSKLLNWCNYFLVLWIFNWVKSILDTFVNSSWFKPIVDNGIHITLFCFVKFRTYSFRHLVICKESAFSVQHIF